MVERLSAWLRSKNYLFYRVVPPTILTNRSVGVEDWGGWVVVCAGNREFGRPGLDGALQTMKVER